MSPDMFWVQRLQGISTDRITAKFVSIIMALQWGFFWKTLQSGLTDNGQESVFLQFPLIRHTAGGCLITIVSVIFIAEEYEICANVQVLASK